MVSGESVPLTTHHSPLTTHQITMRILLLADIHANWPALQALKEPFDVCLCLGDYVDYGLEPAPCIDWVRVNSRARPSAAITITVPLENVVVTAQSGFKYLTSVTRPLTRQLLPASDLRYLADLPVTAHVTFDDMRFLLVHATPRDPLDEYAARRDRILGTPTGRRGCGHHLRRPHARSVCAANRRTARHQSRQRRPAARRRSTGLVCHRGRPEGRAEALRVSGGGYGPRHPGDALPDAAKKLLIEVYRTGEARSHKAKTATK